MNYFLSIISNILNPDLRQIKTDFVHMNKIGPGVVFLNINPSSKNYAEAGGLLELRV